LKDEGSYIVTETRGSELEERIRRLEQSVGAVVSRAEKLDPSLLHRGPDGEEWSLTQILAHIAEMVPYWAQQAQTVASRTEDNLPFGRTHDDPDRIGAVEQHANDRLEDVLPRIREGMADAVTLLGAIPAEGWKRTAHHARRGEMSVAMIVDQFLVEHAEEHAAQAEATLTALGARSD
jgi:uncharacterized damage-inducible protein DinB